MAVDVRLASFLLFFISPIVFAQERCGYMIAIPRDPRPDDLPVLNFEGQTWSQRPLLPAPDREDLCMDGYHVITATLGAQVIYMEEEIEGEITIAILNYNGSNTPYIESPFLSGSFNLLMPVIRRVPANVGEWHLIITQRQDYETPGMQQYMFNVRVEDQPLVVSVSLLIVNIDDNPPIIQNFEPCTVPELGEPGLTECVYQVSDADGRISTEFMSFRIDSDRGDNETFHIQGTNIPNQWMWLNMTIGVNTTLNFEINPLHIFSVTALDSLPNTHTVTMMVQVQNVDSRPPRWLEIFAVQQFDEKTYQNFTVRAIDGDTGIDMPINYRLITAEEDTFFSIETLPGGRSGAIFYVQPIDRDTLQREVFQLTIVAYKYDNESFSTPTNVVIIVNDINDQTPEPLHEEYHLAIMEETPMTLNFDEEFGFHDRDLGQNAQYTVQLESVFPPGVAEAFYIAPEVGYQRQTFIMGTLNHSMLDYEVPEFQHITLRVVATDNNDTSHVGVAMVYIDLINWNDEQPIFEHSVQTVSFDETEGEGFYVATALALDRDIGDRVEHALLGNAVNYLTIEEDTGQIYVSANDSFDYHRQSELFVQVRATDTLGEPYHTVTSQLIIQLNDINNTPPTLRLPRGSPQVEENVPTGYVISDEVRATDPDTTAELIFEINWNTSYATKQGRETDPIEFRNCVEIETIYPEINNRGLAIGRVVVREIRYNVTIDYEEFEMLYLTVRVRDLNTVYGDDYDESTFTITIIDMNDNPPLWVEGTLDQQFRVREGSLGGVVVGSVRADDIDGPLYNQVRYTMFPREDTDDDLVMIDFLTGQITVNTSGAIDADTPPRFLLYYTIIASDRCSADDPADCPPDPYYWETEGNITIDIIDTNNKVPQAETERFPTIVYIYENATHLDEVVTLVASDLDRDEIYHTVSYVINYGVNPRLRNFFSVDRESGLVYVDYTTDEVLDRDGDEPRHQIFFNLIDNFYGDGEGNRNQNDTEVLVVLLDVNDNAPELPPANQLSWSISESLQKGVRLQPDIYAPDRDEPDTDNSRVGYEILNLSTDRDIVVPDLFVMIQIQNVTGELETAMDLQGFWGTYTIHIRAFDHGIPQQSSNETYELVIRPYNFHAPVFVFPRDGAIIRLARERAVVNGVLATVNGEFLDRVEATDEDGLHAGIVTFEVVGDAESEAYFEVLNDGENLGSLRLLQLFPEEIKEFRVTIRATDQGTEPGPEFTDITIRVVFVPTQGEPTFTTSEHTVAFIEQSAGLNESHELPLAEDVKNHLCTDNCYNIYYKIIDGNSDGHFGLDPVRNVLFLEKELDREESATHTLQVAASNSPEGGIPLPASILTVTVIVREADPRPIFVREVYTAGISISDSIGRDLLVLHATQSEGAAVTYTIDQETMVVDPTLEGVRLSAFILNPQTGVLTLNIQPTSTMHGMFNFQVVATDTAGATDRTNVTIYIVSSQNRVYFVFINTLQQVEDNRDFIADTFTAGFNMICNIDQVLPANDPETGVALDYRTQVRGHFIRDNLPVPADEIEQIRSDLVLLSSIQTTLATRLLVLQDLLTGSSPDAGADSSQLTVYVLAALSTLLAFMCLVLLLTFIIRTKALNRRLEALSMTKYGSLDSGLNRAGIAAPGTNKHTVEGSNPIYNEVIKTPELDATSEGSDDSDLIGIEDLPHFSNFFNDPETNEKANGYPDSIANHNNNFAFNPTPFSPEFTNGQFRKI